MNVKVVVGILLVGIVASIFFAVPALAYFNGIAGGDTLQIQQREQRRNLEHEGNCSMLQTQKQERLRMQNQECGCNCTQTQTKQRAGECLRNRTGAQRMNMDQVRGQHREGS